MSKSAVGRLLERMGLSPQRPLVRAYEQALPRGGQDQAVRRLEQGRLELFYLPPYSPELNLDEWVWKNIKHDRVGRVAARSVADMKVVIEKAVARLQPPKDIVCGFFRSPDLSYITG